jgi:hypothetical protein
VIGEETAMRAIILLAVVATPIAPATSQSLTSRVRNARDGEVRIAFAAREGICGDGETFIRDRNRDGFITMRNWSGRGRNWRDRPCEDGPVRVALRVRDGEVRSAKVYVGGEWRESSNVTDLGEIGAAQAAHGLLELARSTSGGSDLLFPATIADSVTIWPDLLSLARDKDAARSSRKQAVFWVSQAAGDKVADGLRDLVADDDEDREVRESAVFALSQLPREEGVPILIRVARTNRDPEIRKKALFWLGQSEDPRALALFEEILTKP